MPDVETPMKYFVRVCRYLRHGLIDKIRNFTSLLNNLGYYPTLDMTTHNVVARLSRMHKPLKGY